MADTEKSNQVVEHDEQVDAAEQPFLDHIIELRQRILRSLMVIIALFVPIYFYANELYTFVAAPLMAHLPNNLNNMGR